MNRDTYMTLTGYLIVAIGIMLSVISCYVDSVALSSLIIGCIAVLFICLAYQLFTQVTLLLR